MRIGLAACIAAGLFAMASLAQDRGASVYEGAKVANFAVPGADYGTAEYEALSFWSGPRGKAIDYAYGANDRHVRLRHLGANADGKGFAVGFPNGLVLDVVPQDKALQVKDRTGNYSKRFQWRYEGPVAGRGTFCTPCVDESEAIDFVREHFME